MISWRKPSVESIRNCVSAQAKRAFTYPEIGATATVVPAAYTVDHSRIRLGKGEKTFLTAVSVMQRWEQFQLAWIEAAPVDTPIAEGNAIAITARAIGFWWLNVCRIIYVIDEAGPIARFGFAYGTLPEHVECGEERFMVEWNRSDGSVYYDILAFSRPRHLLAKIGYPLVRRAQKRFGRDSAMAMCRTVNSPLAYAVVQQYSTGTALFDLR